MSLTSLRSARAILAFIVTMAAWVASPVAAGSIPTDSSLATAFGTQRKVLKATSGTLALLYQRGRPSTGMRGLVVAVSRDRGATWTDELELSSSSSMVGDAYIAASNDIHVVFSRDASGAGNANNVTYAKLVYNAGTDSWSLGMQGLVLDGNTSIGGSYAVLGSDGTRLFSSFRYWDGTTYSLLVRSSSDGGATWADALQAEAPHANSSNDMSMLVPFGGDKLALIYYSRKSDLRWRWRNASDPATTWSAAEVLVAAPMSDKDGFSAVADDYGSLHLVYNAGVIKYMAYDGVSWGPATTLATGGTMPTLASNGLDLWAIWQKKVSDTAYQILSLRTFDFPQVWDTLVEPLSDDITLNLSPVSTAVDIDGPVVAWRRKIPGGGLEVATLAMDAPPGANLRPRLSITASPTNGIAPELVVFTANAFDPDGTVVSYVWDFGDGTGSTVANPTHKYSLAGTYTASLTVTDNEGAQATRSVVITINPNLPPVISISATPTFGYRPLKVQFTATATDPEGYPMALWWDFGDGNGSASLSPLHTYMTAGNYTATFTATDHKGLMSSASVNITVEHNEFPVVSITGTPLAGPVGMNVTFTSTASDADGTIASYLWDFGDGSTSTEMHPAHLYNAPGIFTATLTVEDNRGAPASASLIVRVSSLTSNTRLATAFQNHRKIVRASSGTLAMIYQKGGPVGEGNGLRLAISRTNGDSWSDSILVYASSADYADMIIDPVTNDIDVAFARSENAAHKKHDAGYARLSYQAGTDSWVLSQTTLVHDSIGLTGAYNASIARDAQYLWIAYRFLEGGQFSTVVQYSADEGLTWQMGPAVDVAGTNADETVVFARFGNKLGLLYLHQDKEFRWRTHTDGAAPGDWSPVETVYTLKKGLSGSKSSYSVAVDSFGNVHLMFHDFGLRLVTFDGVAWDNPGVVVSAEGALPSLSTNGSDLWAFYESSQGNGETRVIGRYRPAATGVWSQAAFVSDPVGANAFVAAIHSDPGGPIVAWTQGVVRPYAVQIIRVGPLP